MFPKWFYFPYISSSLLLSTNFKFVVMETLGYDSSVENFRIKKTDTIVLKGRPTNIFSYFIHDYYPIKHFGHEVDEEIENVRKIVFAFKDGKNSSLIANMIYSAIQKSEISLNNAFFIPIPASTPEKTAARYNTFSEKLCRNLGIPNGIYSITATAHECTKGTSGGNKIEHFTFDTAKYEGKNVLLFDDVRTSGTTFKQTATKLLATGANSVTGIFLAKTVSYLK